MTSIKGYADLLIKGVSGALNPQQQQFVDVVRNNVTRMDRMFRTSSTSRASNRGSYS